MNSFFISIVLMLCLIQNIQCKKHDLHYLNRSRYLRLFTKASNHHSLQKDFPARSIHPKNHNRLLAFHDGTWKFNTLEEYREIDIHETQPPVLTHHHIRHHPELNSPEIHWPVKKEAVVEGHLVLGGLMMVHEREDSVTCGPIMPQGGIQALEAMLYTLDRLNEPQTALLPNISLGAHILDDCDKDTYGLEMAVDFIKGKS